MAGQQITLKDIVISYDFKVWGADILNCSFIESITEAEVEMYQEFLLKSDTTPDYNKYYEWQNYSDIKDADNEHCDIPEWYEYHNLRTGKNSLLLLPNIRGDKEEFYMKLSRDENMKNCPPEDPNRDMRPFMKNIYEEDFLKFFVTTFDDTDARKWYQNYSSGKSSISDERMHYEELVSSMVQETENIPIAAHQDFRQALPDCL
ncbi:hypothetical protein [Flavobacterium sp. 3HN19-14]|uniref:hypothetical protein n=1 Tax=Flavobacterium sp. 3HN19-14 TaxID=3448133 RepID=UPI003EE225A5